MFKFESTLNFIEFGSSNLWRNVLSFSVTNEFMLLKDVILKSVYVPNGHLRLFPWSGTDEKRPQMAKD